MSVKTLDSRRMEKDLEENVVSRLFLGLDDQLWSQVRDHSNIARAQEALGVEGWQEVNELIVGQARRLGFGQGEILSSDTTVQEPAIGYPHEAGILNGEAQRVYRGLVKLKEKGSGAIESGKEKAKEIFKTVKEYHLLAKTQEKKDELLNQLVEQTKQLMAHSREVIKQVGGSSQRVKQSVVVKLGQKVEVSAALLPQILQWLQTRVVARGKIVHAGMTGARAIVKNKAALNLVASARESVETARRYVNEHLAPQLVERHRQTLNESLSARVEFIRRGFGYQEAELAAARTKLRDKASTGSKGAKAELTKVKERQSRLKERREEAIAVLQREPELISAAEVTFLAQALVVPSHNPEEQKRHDAQVEAIAVRAARAYEESLGAVVQDVSTPAAALAAGLEERPGFDLLSTRPGAQALCIEVKGRAGVGDIELTENEWVKACNLREQYWLYVVFDCASAQPRLLRVQDPFHKLLFRAKGGVVIDEQEIFGAEVSVSSSTPSRCAPDLAACESEEPGEGDTKQAINMPTSQPWPHRTLTLNSP